MKPEDEIVTARITRKEAEAIATKRWMRPRLKKMTLWMLSMFTMALIIQLIDSVGMEPKAHRIGAFTAYIVMGFLLAGFAWPYYLGTHKADRIGKEEANKLIV